MVLLLFVGGFTSCCWVIYTLTRLGRRQDTIIRSQCTFVLTSCPTDSIESVVVFCIPVWTLFAKVSNVMYEIPLVACNILSEVFGADVRAAS